MLRAEKRVIQDVRDAPGIRALSIPFEIRQKSRFRAVLDDGTELAVFLPRGSSLADGDLLEADDRTLIRIVAAPERLLYVTASSPRALNRAAYHLGNRHTPVEIGNGFLKLEHDPVLREMLTGLGLQVREESLPFQPEPGAYHTEHRHDFESEEQKRAQELFHDHHSCNHGSGKAAPQTDEV
jgi:urease accessory protein